MRKERKNKEKEERKKKKKEKEKESNTVKHKQFLFLVITVAVVSAAACLVLLPVFSTPPPENRGIEETTARISMNQVERAGYWYFMSNTQSPRSEERSGSCRAVQWPYSPADIRFCGRGR